MATLTASGIDCSNGTLNGQYTGTTYNNTSYPIGSYLLIGFLGYSPWQTNNASATIAINPYGPGFSDFGGSTVMSGTWRARGSVAGVCYTMYVNLYQRVA